MISEENLARFNTLEEATVHFAQRFAECSHKGDHEGAKAALREILRLYPKSAPARENFELQCGHPVIVSSMYLGHIYREKGTRIDLSDVFRNPAFIAVSGDRFDQVYLRTISGNLYRIAHSSTEGTYHLADAKARRKFSLAPSFPRDYTVTIGAPFSGDVLKGGGPMLRRTSAISEIVLVCTSRRFDLDTLHSLASDESSIVDEYENVLGSKGVTLGVETAGTIAIHGSPYVGYSIHRASLRELLSHGGGGEAIGAVTHVFIRTASGNIYRIQRDVPAPGQVTVTDLRISQRNRRPAERTYALAELTTVIVEEGTPFRLGNAVTSPVREIVAFNTDSSFTPRELMDSSGGAVTTIVDDFNRDLPG